MIEPRFPVTEKVWGTEELIVNTPLYCAKYLNVAPRGTSSLHLHRVKDETFVVLDGTCILNHCDSLFILQAGMQHRIRPSEQHRFTSLQGCRILEVSTNHSDEDVVRLEPSKRN